MLNSIKPKLLFTFLFLSIISLPTLLAQSPKMYFSDTFVANRPFAKDPYVIFFKNQYWMYYTVPDELKKVLHIGIATSNDLNNWIKLGIYLD